MPVSRARTTVNEYLAYDEHDQLLAFDFGDYTLQRALWDDIQPANLILQTVTREPACEQRRPRRPAILVRVVPRENDSLPRQPAVKCARVSGGGTRGGGTRCGTCLARAGDCTSELTWCGGAWIL